MPYKKVLMLCYHHPPAITPGTARSVAFVTNLKELGWACMAPISLDTRSRDTQGVQKEIGDGQEIDVITGEACGVGA